MKRALLIITTLIVVALAFVFWPGSRSAEPPAAVDIGAWSFQGISLGQLATDTKAAATKNQISIGSGPTSSIEPRIFMIPRWGGLKYDTGPTLCSSFSAPINIHAWTYRIGWDNDPGKPIYYISELGDCSYPRAPISADLKSAAASINATCYPSLNAFKQALTDHLGAPTEIYEYNIPIFVWLKGAADPEFCGGLLYSSDQAAVEEVAAASAEDVLTKLRSCGKVLAYKEIPDVAASSVTDGDPVARFEAEMFDISAYFSSSAGTTGFYKWLENIHAGVRAARIGQVKSQQLSLRNLLALGFPISIALLAYGSYLCGSSASAWGTVTGGVVNIHTVYPATSGHAKTWAGFFFGVLCKLAGALMVFPCGFGFLSWLGGK